MRGRHTIMAGLLASGMVLASACVSAAATVMHFTFENGQLMFDKQTGGRNCDANNPKSKDTCAKKGEGAYMLNFNVKGPANGCSLVGMDTMGRAASLDYANGKRVAAQSSSAKSLTIKNKNSVKEDITYEIVYTCNGVEKRWHPTLKNRPWD